MTEKAWRGMDFLTSDLTEDIAAVKIILDTATAVEHLFAPAPSPEDRKDVLRQVIACIEVRDRKVESLSTSPRGTRAA